MWRGVEMRYAYRRTSEEGELPRILFYSVLLHYVVFYIMFGNPFLVQKLPGTPSPGSSIFDVQLSVPPPEPPAGGPKPEPVNRNISLGGSRSDMTEEEISRLFQAPEGFREGKALGAVSRISVAGNALSDGISFVDTLNPPPEAKQISVPKNTIKDLPANVTGPEDCLLKVVGMVCPNGDAACIAAYKKFCASLAR